MRLVPLNSVREGSELAKTIYDIDGRVLLSAGVDLGPSILKKIRENNIFSIYINDEYSQNEIEDIIKPELRQKATKVIKETYDSFSKITKAPTTSSVKKKQAAELKYESVNNINDITKSVLEDIMTNKDICISLVDIKSMNNYVYQHSVNVTILSLIIGLELGLNRDKLMDLAAGAMLHDLGRTLISDEILLKPGPLTPEEYEIVKEHPTKGYEFLKDNMYVSGVSRMIILQHHEKNDGSGYPRGIKGDSINDLAKIVSIADTYDALTSDRPYRKANSPNEALEYIMGGAGRLFDFEAVSALMRRIIPYPVGTMVKLSNGDVGVVDSLNPSFPLRPRIRVVRQKNVTIEMINIDLMKEKNIIIEGVQYDAPNLSVPNYLKNG